MIKANKILKQHWCLYYCAVIAAIEALGTLGISEYIKYKKLCLIPNAAIKLKCLVSKWKAHKGFWEM